jgi:HlyD family secretion protein
MNPAPAVPKPAAAAPAAPVRRKSNTKWFVIGGIVLVLLGSVGAYLKKRGTTGAVAVTTEKAIIKTITQTVSATGKVQPETEVRIAPEVSGEITQLNFREGAVVKKGDLLLTIRPDAYKAQVEQQEANLVAAKAGAVQARAQLLQAQDALKRSEDLFQKQLISDSDILGARTSVEVAQANYDNSLAQIRRSDGTLSQMKDQLTKTMIYAPIDGKVSSLSNEIGDRVAGVGSYGGAEVMRVADLDHMEVRVMINENDIVNVKVGDKAKISIDAFPDRKFDGVVKEIGSAAKITGQGSQDEVTNFQVKIRITDKDAPLRPGMSANTDVLTKTVENAVAVPIQSVTVRSKEGAKTMEQIATDREKKKDDMKGEGAATAVNAAQQKLADKADRESLQRGVFVRLPDNKVKWVPVETGVQDTAVIEIKSNLKAGDEVVSGSFGAITRTLKDGMTIMIEKPKKDAPKKS